MLLCRLPHDFKQTSRRNFFYSAVALPSAAALVAQEPRPVLSFPLQPHQRLAVTSYPFRELIDSPTNKARNRLKPGMDLKEFPAFAAREFGVQNINPLADHMSSTDRGYLESFRKAVADAGSHLVDLGLGGQNFASTDAAVRKEAIEYGRRWIDVALAIGSPSVRQHLRVVTGMKPSVPIASESLARLAEYGAKKNIVVNLENDSAVSEDPFFIVEVLHRVNEPYLRALPDFGNSLRGHDAAFNERAVSAMFAHAFNMSHVKDKLVTSDGTVYKVDVGRMFAIARLKGYRGYFSMEFDTAAGDAVEGTRNLVKQSLAFLGEEQG